MKRVVLLLIFLAFYGDHLLSQGWHDITGRVTVGPDRAPISVMVVLHSSRTLKTRSAMTDQNGLYFFDCLEDGEYELSVELDGFLTKRIGGILFAYPDTVNLDIEMVPQRRGGLVFAAGPVVALRVFDTDDSTEIPNAQVTISGSAPTEPGETDGCGRFFQRLPPGTYEVTITANSYTQTNFTLRVGGERIFRKVYLTRAR